MACHMTFLTIVPKYIGDKIVKDFRLNTLFPRLYKFIVKVLVNKLKPTLSMLMSENQCASIEYQYI